MWETIYFMAKWVQQLRCLIGFTQLFHILQFGEPSMAQKIACPRISVIPQLGQRNPPHQALPTALAHQKIIDSSLVAMRQLTRQSLIEWPTYKLLTLSLKKTLPTAKIEAIDVKLVKSAVTQVATNTLPLNNAQGLTLWHSEESNGIVKRVALPDFHSESFISTLKQQFNSFTGKVLAAIHTQLQNNQKLAAIDLAWIQSALDQIFKSSKEIIESCQSHGEILALAEPSTANRRKEINQEPSYERQLLQFRLLLSKLSGNVNTKLELIKLFERNASNGKDNDAERWMACCKDLEETIRSQMNEIKTQQQEKEELESKIEELNRQLAENEERMSAIEKQMSVMEEELRQLKEPVVQTDSYYMNPMYDRAQLEEKLLMEMIEVESDLLLGRDQIRLMTDAIVELIKLSQCSMQDLQASSYFLNSFKRSVLRITKDIKSLESVDLEQLLNIKEDTHSIYDSQLGLEETRRSHISTRSEIEFDHKLSRITEDDSLSAIQGQ